MKKAGDYLLDTTAAIGFAKKDQALIALAQAGTNIYVPVVAIAEMYFGAFKSGRTAQNLLLVEKLAKQSKVLVCDIETARAFAQKKQELRRKGRPIPENDIWIAAIAKQHGLTVLTRDGHFQEVDNLSVTGC